MCLCRVFGWHKLSRLEKGFLGTKGQKQIGEAGSNQMNLTFCPYRRNPCLNCPSTEVKRSSVRSCTS